MALALIALLGMSTASILRDRVVLYPVHYSLGGELGPKLTQKGGQEDQVEKLREITKPGNIRNILLQICCIGLNNSVTCIFNKMHMFNKDQ